MTDIDVDALMETDESRSVKSMCYKTVDVFAGITGRKLWLKASRGGARTNGYLIEVPFEDPRAYQYTEHELSHILFGSDALAQIAFVQTYADRIAEVAAKSGVTLNPRSLRKVLTAIVGILDDERVISLWGLLYAGSEAIMRRMKRDQAAPWANDAHVDLVTLLGVLAGGHDPPPGKLDRYKPYMVEALRKVHLRDYQGVLVTSKWLITMLVGEVIRESRGLPPLECPPLPTAPRGLGDPRDDEDDSHPIPGQGGSEGGSEGSDGSGVPELPYEANGASEGAQDDSGDDPDGRQAGGHGQDAWEPPEVDANLHERTSAMEDIVDLLGAGPKELLNSVDDVTESKFKRAYEEERAKRIAAKAVNADVKDSGRLETALEASAEAMHAIVERARHATKNALNEDDRIRHDAMAKVVFTDVEVPDDVDLRQPLPPRDEETVRRLRAQFFKVMGRRAHRLEEAGVEVDVQAVIERRLTREPIPVFRTQVMGRGFQALILVDRSSSMQGPRTKLAERSCRIISRSLKFPFVRTDTWGFQSLKRGEVNITRFLAGQEVFESQKAMVGGTTPLHTALRVGVRFLEQGSDRKHLFLISDGFPVFSRRDGAAFGTGTLMSFVRNEVQRARSKGIGITGVMIGKDFSSKGMGYMFGPERYWRVMNEHTFGTDLVTLVSKSFVDYLRGG